MFWQLQPVIQVDWFITTINETIQTYIGIIADN